MEFLLQICLWWFLHVFCFSVMFTLLLAVSITLSLLQQQQQLTSSLQSVCTLFLLIVLPTTLFYVEAADDGLTFDFQHNNLHSSSYKAYCPDLHFTAISH